MKHSLCLMMLLGIAIGVKAHLNADIIKGIVKDASQHPIEYANISLLSPDSTFICGTCSREDGSFELANVPSGNYILQVSYIGYQTLSCPCIGGDTGEWVLLPAAIMLKEATVTARRPMFKLKSGALETKVKGSILGTLNDANDVLKHIPGLRATEDGYTVFGKGSPVIYINGRKLQDNSELNQLSAADIDKVELINNPGAEYDATVKAVIRIQTVRTNRNGFGSSLRTGIIQGRRTSYYEQATLSSQKENLLLTGMLYHGHNSSKRTQSVEYDIPADVEWAINSKARFYDKGDMLRGKVSASYDFNPQHSFGVSYELIRTPDFHLNGISNYTVKANEVLTDYTDYLSTGFQQDLKHQFNVYYLGKVKNLQINFNADFIWGKNNEDQESEENSETEGIRQINSFTNANNRLYAAKLVMTYPLLKGKFNFGGDYTFIRRRDHFNNVQSLLPKTNSRIDERKVAGFAEYSRSLGVISLTAGLRFEHAVSNYWEEDLFVPGQSHTYDNWFPNLSVEMPIGKIQTNLSYTVKTNRPSFFQLRSSMNYNNRFIYEAGNPLLIPETNHDLQFTAIYKWMQFTANYQYRKNAIDFMAKEYEEDPNVAIFTFDNFRRYQILNFSVNLSPAIGKWKPELGLFFTQPFFRVINQGMSKVMNKSQFYLICNNSVELPGNTILSLDIDCQSRGNSGAMLLYSYWRMDMGVRKVLFNKKLTVGLQVSDIVHTRKNSFMLFGPKLTYSKHANPDSQQVALTIRYTINAPTKSYRGKHVSESDIRRIE